MADADYLVCGATGATGGSAVTELLSMGARVRAYVREDGEKATALRNRGVDVAVGDFSDIDAILAALHGVEAAYFLYPITPGIIPAATCFAQAAKEAGVASIVNMSQISARRDSKSHAARDHWIAEQVFDWSGVPTTHLRPTFFADWLIYPWFAKDIWDTKTIAFPFAHGRHAPIASEDQGRVIAHLLAKPESSVNNIYKLHGPVEMDHAGIAAAMSEVLQAEITYAPMTIPEFKAKLDGMGFPEFLIQHLVEVARDYQDGLFAGINDVVERVTGRPPLTVQEFISKHRDAFA